MFEAAKRSQEAIDAAYREQRRGDAEWPRARQRPGLSAALAIVPAAIWAALAIGDRSDRWLHVGTACLFALTAALNVRAWRASRRVKAEEPPRATSREPE